MIETSTDQPAAPALQAAVDSLDVAVEHLIKLVDDGALGDLGAFGLVDTLQSLEKVRNKLPVVDRAMIQYGTEQGVPATLSERTERLALKSELAMVKAAVEAAEGRPDDARQRLKALGTTLRQSGMVLHELERRLLVLRIDREDGRPDVRAGAAALEKDARARGAGLIASRAVPPL